MRVETAPTSSLRHAAAANLVSQFHRSQPFNLSHSALLAQPKADAFNFRFKAAPAFGMAAPHDTEVKIDLDDAIGQLDAVPAGELPHIAYAESGELVGLSEDFVTAVKDLHDETHTLFSRAPYSRSDVNRQEMNEILSRRPRIERIQSVFDRLIRDRKPQAAIAMYGLTKMALHGQNNGLIQRYDDLEAAQSDPYLIQNNQIVLGMRRDLVKALNDFANGDDAPASDPATKRAYYHTVMKDWLAKSDLGTFDEIIQDLNANHGWDNHISTTRGPGDRPPRRGMGSHTTRGLDGGPVRHNREIDGDLTALTGVVGGHTARHDRHDEHLGRVDHTLADHGHQLNTHGTRLTALEAGQQLHEQYLATLRGKGGIIHQLQQRQAEIGRDLASVIGDEGALAKLNERLTAVDGPDGRLGQLATALDNVTKEGGDLATIRKAIDDITKDDGELKKLEAAITGITAPGSAVATLQTTVEQHTRQIEGLGSSLSGVQSTVGGHATQIGELRRGLGAVQGTVGDHTNQIGELGRGLGAVQGTVGEHTGQIEGLTTTVGQHGERLTAVEEKATTVATQLTDLTKPHGRLYNLRRDVIKLTEDGGPVSEVRKLVEALTGPDGVITDIQKQVAAITGDGGPIATLSGGLAGVATTLTELTKDGGRLHQVEQALGGLAANGEAIAAINQQLGPDGNFGKVLAELNKPKTGILATIRKDISDLAGRMQSVEDHLTGTNHSSSATNSGGTGGSSAGSGNGGGDVVPTKKEGDEV